MNVEIDPVLRDTAANLGAGVPYALKAVAGLLADDPDLGEPSGLPGILTVMIDGDMFEDCPALAIGYIREPDRVEIRFANRIGTPEPVREEDAADEAREQRQPADPAAAALTVRQTADAWHRITHWLQRNAPASYAALRPGAAPAEIAALESELGIRTPVELHALWLLTAGDDGVGRAGCLPGNQALMTLDAVATVYRRKMDIQADEDTLSARRPDAERTTIWKPAWIPVVAHDAADTTYGLYLDTETGYLGRWSRYNEPPGEELDTLVTYLEETADMLETPALATRDKPGLIDGRLVWGSMLDPSQEGSWQPLTGGPHP